MKELKRVLKKSGVIFWNHGDCYGGVKFGKTDKKVSDYVKDSQKNLRKIAPRYSKCMMLQNYRFILRCIDELGLILRNIIIWYKPNHMPSSVKDRFTSAYEPVFMLVKSRKYWFDLDAVRIPHKSKPDFSRVVKTNSKAKNIPWYGGQVRNNHDIHTSYHPIGKNPGDLWIIPTQPFSDSHFAVFPEKLVEPMIKAGCPQEGLVLDPFAGSGTTNIVAEKLGRNSIGIEINSDYVAIIKKRFEPFLKQAKLNGRTELNIIKVN